MSCPANMVLANASTNGYQKPSPEDLERIKAELLADILTSLAPASTVSANAVLARAATNGFFGPSPENLKIIQAQLLCDILAVI